MGKTVMKSPCVINAIYKGTTEGLRDLYTGTRQLGACQIRHRLKKQTRHLLNSAPVKFGHLRFANSAPDF